MLIELSAALQGALLGSSAGLSPGPTSSLVISRALKGGWKEGAKVACAPLVTDLPIIALAVLLLRQAAHVDLIMGLISLAGAGLLTFFAIGGLKLRSFDGAAAGRGPGFWQAVTANATNPMPYIFWISAGGNLLLGFWDSGWLAALLFGAGFLALIVATKALLAVVAGLARDKLSARWLVFLSRALSASLLIFAVQLTIKAAKLMF